MKRWLILILLVSLSFNVGLLVKRDQGEARSSRSRGSGRGWPALADSEAWHSRIEHRAERMGDHLGLDPHQREAFLRHHRDAADAILDRRRSQERGREELREIVLEQPLDPDRLRAAVARLGHEQAVLDSLVAEKMLQEMEILEPEQRLQMLRMLPWDDHGQHDRPHGRRGRHGGGQGGGQGDGQGRQGG